MEANKAIVVFQDKRIRRIWYNKEWFYSVADIAEGLTDSPAPRQYWGKVKGREFIAPELSPIWVQLTSRKKRETNSAHKKQANQSSQKATF